MSARIFYEDECNVTHWFRKRRCRVPPVAWQCLVYHHMAGGWKRERNRQWMLSILRAMEAIKAEEFYGERQRLMARNYPKPTRGNAVDKRYPS